MMRPAQLKVRAHSCGDSSGKAGKARGHSAKSILDYCKDRAATDYYGEAGQAKQQIAGTGWAGLGLEGDQPSDEQLLNLLNGLHLDAQERRGTRKNKEGEVRPGTDFTFSCPKSVSAIKALADDETAKKIQEAFEQSVKDAINYMEAEGFAQIRMSQKSSEHEPAKISAALFFHETNRHEDPQMHAHAICFNAARGSDGKVHSVDYSQAYRHGIEIGAVFRAALADRMIKLGFSIERDGKSFRVVGTPNDLELKWSKGSAKIQDQLAEWGLSKETASGAQKQAAALIARPDKAHSSKAALNERWIAEAEELGVTSEQIASLRHVDAPGVGVEYNESNVIAELTRKKATFRNIDMRKAVALEMAAGGGDIADIRAAIDKLKQNEQLIELIDQEGHTLWTTKEMRDLETAMVENIDRGKGKGRPIDDDIIQKAIDHAQQEKGFAFNDEQIGTIKMVLSSQDAYTFCQGVAGAGKTSLCRAIALGFEKEGKGREVIGMAMASKAATGLGDGTGIETSTIDSFLYRLKSPNQPKPKPGSVLIVDESNMNSTSQIAALVEAAAKHDLQICMLGDAMQLQAIQAGSAWSYLYERADASQKSEINISTRQKNAEFRDFVHGIREKKTDLLFDYLDAKGNLKISEKDEEVKDAVKAWLKNREAGVKDKSNLFVTNRNDMRIRLNQAVREITGQANRADNVTVETTNRNGESTGRTSFASGDRVITLKNEKSLRISGSNEKGKMDNGQCWTVLATKQITGSSHALLTLESDAGKRIQFSTEEYNSISHAWALTVHQSEGVTCTGLVALPADASMVDIHSWYVMMSRSRSADHTHIVMPESLLDDVEAASGLAENESLSDRERLKSFLKNAEREGYDHLSIKFKTKAEVEAQIQTQAEAQSIAQPTAQTEVPPAQRQGRSIRR